ncbi:MAG TPA: hypothetical protein VHZ55_32865, partial [Bryobacteraceae bacterium]|nr:hypothetical protein [Bryobacteraceae bacterium]
EGVSQPFYARLDSAVEKRAHAPLPMNEPLKVRQDLGTFGEMVDSTDASVGVFEFEDVTGDYVIKRGMQITGTTAAPK